MFFLFKLIEIRKSAASIMHDIFISLHEASASISFSSFSVSYNLLRRSVSSPQFSRRKSLLLFVSFLSLAPFFHRLYLILQMLLRKLFLTFGTWLILSYWKKCKMSENLMHSVLRWMLSVVQLNLLGAIRWLKSDWWRLWGGWNLSSKMPCPEEIAFIVCRDDIFFSPFSRSRIRTPPFFRKLIWVTFSVLLTRSFSPPLSVCLSVSLSFFARSHQTRRRIWRGWWRSICDSSSDWRYDVDAVGWDVWLSIQVARWISPSLWVWILAHRWRDVGMW